MHWCYVLLPSFLAGLSIEWTFWLDTKYDSHRKLYFVFSLSQQAPNASISVENTPKSLVHAWAQLQAPAAKQSSQRSTENL